LTGKRIYSYDGPQIANRRENPMSSRRTHHRVATLSPEERQAIERDAQLLLSSIRRALTKLVPFNESYSALYRLGDEMRGALNVIAGRPWDHAEPIVGPSAMPPPVSGDAGGGIS
jgi:hypothetical protein